MTAQRVITSLVLLVASAGLSVSTVVAMDSNKAAMKGGAHEASEDVRNFCSNIADDARDLRYARKASELKALQAQVEERIAVLEEKNREFEAWIERRETFRRQAQDGLVEIYAKMRPDAAAVRLEMLGTELAAAILMKLSPRQAGVILNEMDVEKAAMVTGIISAAGQKRDPA